MRGLLKIVGIVALVAVAVPVGAAAAASSKDQALLDAGLVRPTDVPETWGQSTQADTGLSQLNKIPACKQYRALVVVARKNAFRLSPRFSDPSNGGGTSAEDTVYVFKNAATATKYVTGIFNGSAVSCLQTFLQRQVGSQGEVGPLTPITGLGGVGDQSLGVEADITLPQGTEVVDEVGVRVGRAFVGFAFTNPNNTIPEGPAVVNAVVNRLSQAGA
ncbi:MAG TPA: hypothetical protein VGU73_11540 [Acidimicrobiia bacterium]|nr:hypothetical protein [Acidimicrobiia bacterium]